MAKEQDMQHLLDNPDSLDMDDEDAILALANGAEIPEDADDQDAADQAEVDKTKAAESDTGDDDKGKDDGLTEDDIKAPVQAKDGKHTLPYKVLEDTRNNLKDQVAENARLKALLEEKEAGGNVSDKEIEDAAAEQSSTAATPEEEFFNKNGMTPEDFQKEYGEGLTKSLLVQAKDSLEMRQQLDVLMDDHNQKAKTEEDQISQTLQGAIDAIPELAALQAEGGERWQEAVDTDNALKIMPNYRNADYATRFNAVAKEMGLTVPDKPEASKEKTEADDTDDDLPRSISDLPGGSPASQSNRQTVESMDSADIRMMFEDMTPKQQEEYLNNL